MTAMSEQRKEQIRASRRATKLKRQSQKCRVRTLKIQQNKLSRQQKDHLHMMFTEAKWIRNAMIAGEKLADYQHDPAAVPVKLRDGQIEYRAIKHLGSQIQQSVQQQVWQDAMSLSARKQAGHRIGRLKFKSSVDSLELKQYGVTYRFKSESKLKIQKVPGLLRMRGASQLRDLELASAKLIRRPDGYYLAVTTYENRGQVKENFQAGTVIGLDMGVSTHITLSNGSKINVLVEETDRLKRLQRKLARQVKGSNNREKTKQLILREYQKMNNRKDEAANQLVAGLLRNELVFTQNEQLASWKKRNSYVKAGRRMQHSILGRVKAKLARHERVVVLAKNRPTTQLCACGRRNKLALNERVYSCSCGYTMDRDVHAAMNMVRIGADAAPERRQELVESVSDWSSEEFQLRSVKREASGLLAQV